MYSPKNYMDQKEENKTSQNFHALIITRRQKNTRTKQNRNKL